MPYALAGMHAGIAVGCLALRCVVLCRAAPDASGSFLGFLVPSACPSNLETPTSALWLASLACWAGQGHLCVFDHKGCYGIVQ